jgi:hypothetical protein
MIFLFLRVKLAALQVPINRNTSLKFLGQVVALLSESQDQSDFVLSRPAFQLRSVGQLNFPSRPRGVLIFSPLPGSATIKSRSAQPSSRPCSRLITVPYSIARVQPASALIGSLTFRILRCPYLPITSPVHRHRASYPVFTIAIWGHGVVEMVAWHFKAPVS